jgi:DNA-binding transcriptional regulator YiaG
MKREECSNCGKPAEIVRRNHRFDEMGLPLVLEGIEVISCLHCGNADPIIPNIDNLMHILAIAVILHDRKLCGPEIKFLRKYVGKNQKGFAELIPVDHTYLCDLETGKDKIGDKLDKLIRFVVLGLSPELRDKIERLVAMLPHIKDASCKRKPVLHYNPEQAQTHYAHV